MPGTPEFNDLIIDIREQVLYLQELGVTELDAKLSERVRSVQPSATTVPAIPIDTRVPAASSMTPVRAEIPNIEIVREQPQARPEERLRISDLPSLSKRSTARPAIDRSAVTSANIAETPLVKDEIARETANPASTEPAIVLPENIAGETVPHIRAEIGPNCVRCKLSQLGRSKVVNSVGNFNAELMFVGEAPGANEDAEGEPFVGRAGQLLTKIIEGIGLTRQDVFIGNINRCRPPGNRAPEPDETVTCKPFLLREIAVVRPKVIVVLGATAAQNLLETKVPIGKLRGHFHDYQGTKVMPTFHPAYLLRDPHKKRDVWEDMKLVRAYLAEQK